jgi:GH15 family glucan-1,4-alpha-glucosidase
MTSLKIEDYALIGNTLTAALVGRNGSIDWLCLPDFDGGACFASLLGIPENGHWIIAPAAAGHTASRAYRPDTAILDTTFATEAGKVTLTDFMPPPRDSRRGPASVVHLARIVRCVAGRMELHTRLVLRFDYGRVIPWVQRSPVGITAIAGPDAVQFQSDVALHGEDFTTVARFTLAEGEGCAFCLTWYPSHLKVPDPVDAARELTRTQRWWRRWIRKATDCGPWNDATRRSLVTLKAMTYSPTGAVVAAPTTSLPEFIGGERNWDYRFCWIRDSTLTLYSLLNSGFLHEAGDWRHWLLRAAAGEPSKLQIMYGLRGERRLTEMTLPWLCGYERSQPVRIGNAAHTQSQLDVYGELMDTMYVARTFEIEPSEEAWSLQKAIVQFVAGSWREPDHGIWEVRGPAQHFTYSKVMAWVALDRAVKSVETFGLEGPIDEWRRERDVIHAEICDKGYSQSKGCFTQVLGGEEVDASLLLLAQDGFVRADDPRYIATVEAVERELHVDGLVLRYRTGQVDDGLAPGEGAFLACSFWLVDAYVLVGRYDDAVRLFERLLQLRNDVGLLAEEYDPAGKRHLGNFPQAFSHVALINAAHGLLAHRRAAATDRAGGVPVRESKTGN